MRKGLAMLLALVMLSSVVSPAMAAETKSRVFSKNIIETKLGKVNIINSNTAEIVAHGEKYRVLVKPVNSRIGNLYMVEVLNSKGDAVWSGVSELNPVEYLKKGQYSVSGLPIPPDANITNTATERERAEKLQLTLTMEV